MPKLTDKPVRRRPPRRFFDCELACSRAPVGDVLGHRRAEDRGLLRDRGDALAQVLWIDRLDVDAIDKDLALVDIVKAHDELEYGRLAGPGGADDGDPFARRDREIEVFQDTNVGRARIREGDTPEFDRAARRRRHERGLRRRDDARLDGEKLGDPPRRTGGGGDFVPHLRQFAERGRAEHGEKHELRQQSAAHAPRQHVARAEPQHEHDAAESERHRNRDEEGTVAAASRAAP